MKVLSGTIWCVSFSSSILQMELLQNFYETTLDALRDAKNERLWFKTMTKLGKLYFDRCVTVVGGLILSAEF